MSFWSDVIILFFKAIFSKSSFRDNKEYGWTPISNKFLSPDWFLSTTNKAQLIFEPKLLIAGTQALSKLEPVFKISAKWKTLFPGSLSIVVVSSKSHVLNTVVKSLYIVICGFPKKFAIKIEKYQSDLLAKNNELFKSVKTR